MLEKSYPYYLANKAVKARAKLDVIEHFAIGAKCAIAIHPAGHVPPMSRLHFAFRGFLEIENGESFRWTGKDARLETLRNGTLRKVSSDASECGNVGAGGEKFKEFAASFRDRGGLARDRQERK